MGPWLKTTSNGRQPKPFQTRQDLALPSTPAASSSSSSSSSSVIVPTAVVVTVIVVVIISSSSTSTSSTSNSSSSTCLGHKTNLHLHPLGRLITTLFHGLDCGADNFFGGSLNGIIVVVAGNIILVFGCSSTRLDLDIRKTMGSPPRATDANSSSSCVGVGVDIVTGIVPVNIVVIIVGLPPLLAIHLPLHFHGVGVLIAANSPLRGHGSIAAGRASADGAGGGGHFTSVSGFEGGVLRRVVGVGIVVVGILRAIAGSAARLIFAAAFDDVV
mmetsp:Transcript_33168/g.67565  ORF Transcript_33168/g.67565 Transcript_33168/m.67565 type:complete len:272 (-) Transcript_33168:163-978(-)